MAVDSTSVDEEIMFDENGNAIEHNVAAPSNGEQHSEKPQHNHPTEEDVNFNDL